MSRVPNPNRRRLIEATKAVGSHSMAAPAMEAAKSADFHPTVLETIFQLGGGWYCGTYGAMYRKQPAVRAVVDFLARNIGQLNAKVYARVSNTDRLELADHPLAVLLRRPNPRTTRYAHMRETVSDLAIYDRAYWRKLRQGRQLSVIRVSPAMLSIEIDPNTKRRTYHTRDGVEVPASELIVFRGYSPDSDDDGVSPLETLRRVLQDESSVQQHRENVWRNAARQSGIIERPLDAPEWSDAARQRYRAEVEAVLAGVNNAGRIAVLEEGMKWNPATFRMDTDYIESRRLTYEEVAIVYGLDPSIIGMGSETKANAEQYHRQVYQDVLGPWLRMIQDELELQLLPEFEPTARVNGSDAYVEFNIAEKLKGSFEEQGKTLVTAVGVPYMTPNEARARLNLPRVDDPSFDMPVQPMNVMYGGQPAVTVPTADPATPPGVLSLSTPAFKTISPPPAAAIRRRNEAAKLHEEYLRKYFDRQEQSVLSAKAVAKADRWDRELTRDLFLLLAVPITRKTGQIAADQLGGVYDVPRTLSYLEENARIAAEAINAYTFKLVAEASTTDDVRHVFEVAKGSRGEQIALGRATTLVNFARSEAAIHSRDRDGRDRTKTWVVTSRRSRHPEMNGETVSVGDTFSNSLRWPGDGHGSADETAGCHCLLQLN